MSANRPLPRSSFASPPPTTDLENAQARRRTMRYVGAVLCAVTAIIYLLIGLRVIIVLDSPTGTPPDQVIGYIAGAAYALGAALLVFTDRRLLWVIGAVFQLFVVVMYFVVAQNRVPDYEVWGLMLRIPQIALFFVLGYLAYHKPPTSAQ